MNDLYIKKDDGKFIPIKLDVATSGDLTDKLIVITVGTEEHPSTDDMLEYVYKKFISSNVIINTMKNSKNSFTNIFVLPHIIKIELLSKNELENKTVCVSVKNSDNIDSLPEIKSKISKAMKKEVTMVPSPLSIKEYEEVKTVMKRIKMRKQRHGGGLNKD